MKLTARVKLQPTTEQTDRLLATLTAANQCYNAISETAFWEKTFKQYALHKLVYQACRQQSRLSSQMVIRAIGRVADSYKAGSKKQRGFRPYGAFPYDARVLSFQLEQQTVSIWKVAGRERMGYVGREQALVRLQGKRGEVDLCYVRGQFYLAVSCEVETAEPKEVDEYLGVDMGIVNLAPDSDGHQYSGSQLQGIGGRRYRQRRRLKAKGTKSARRVLQRLSGKKSG